MGGTLGRMLRRAFFPSKPPVYNITVVPEQKSEMSNLLPLVVVGGLGLLLLTQPKKRGK